MPEDLVGATSSSREDVFTILLLLLLFLVSNLFTYMLRLYRRSLTPVNINIIFILNSYIVGCYYTIVMGLVSIYLGK